MRKVFCWGTFDIIHHGHLEFFQDAKRHGDYLAVIVVSDNKAYANKGKYPVHNQSERSDALKRIDIIDEIILASDNLQKNLERYASMQPDVFVFGYDQQTAREEAIQEYFRAKGLKTEFLASKEFAGGVHTRHII